MTLNGTSLVDAAKAYASMGWPVLPLTPNEKRPLGALVHTGLHEASTDLDQIDTWWEAEQYANIGLRTGIAFDVVDVDGPTGLASMQELVPGYRHAGPIATTGKGYHLLFEPTGAGNAANKLPGLDFRGQNGYIVATPSVHPNGHKYAWGRDGQLPEPTPWLLQLVNPVTDRGTPNPEYLQSVLEHDILKAFAGLTPRQPLPLGQRWITNCIWHDDNTPSLVLYPDDNSFRCYGCGEWGDSLNLMNIAQEAMRTGTVLSPSEYRARPLASAPQ